MSDIESESKLFIGALCSHTTIDSLRRYYEQWGRVVDCVVMHSRGFGFVTFSDKSSVDRAMKMLPHIVDGKVVDAKRATRKIKFGSNVSGVYSRKIFIGGVYGAITKADLFKYFSQFGSVQSATIYEDEVTGDSRGFGFVIFDDPSSVDQALEVHNHTVLGIEIDVRRAEPRDGGSSTKSSSFASGFSSDAGSENVPNHLQDKARYSRRYSTSMHPRLSVGAGGCGTESRSIPVLQSGKTGSGDGSPPWTKGRKSVPPKPSTNLKSLNEAIQTERAFNRQKIVNLEERILELERKLIAKEKECCELKEKLLYEHQRQTIGMAQELASTYYVEPTSSYETAVQQGWTECPRTTIFPDPMYYSTLSVNAQEFNYDHGHNTNNLVPICGSENVLPVTSTITEAPKTSPVIVEMDSSVPADRSPSEGGSSNNSNGHTDLVESGYSSDH